MKKIYLLIFTYLIFPITAFAQDIGISRKNKPGNIPGDMSLGKLIANALQIMYIIGALGVLVFIVWGALDWIMAGGDKEKLAAARKKIINSIVGLFLLALSGFIISLIGEIVGIDVFNLGSFPALFEDPSLRKVPVPGTRDPNS